MRLEQSADLAFGDDCAVVSFEYAEKESWVNRAEGSDDEKIVTRISSLTSARVSFFR